MRVCDVCGFEEPAARHYDSPSGRTYDVAPSGWGSMPSLQSRSSGDLCPSCEAQFKAIKDRHAVESRVEMEQLLLELSGKAAK